LKGEGKFALDLVWRLNKAGKSLPKRRIKVSSVVEGSRCRDNKVSLTPGRKKHRTWDRAEARGLEKGGEGERFLVMGHENIRGGGGQHS